MSVCSLYSLWRPWIDQFGLHFPPVDPLHCTLFYDRDQDFTYREDFHSNLEGQHWHLTSRGLLVASEGVVAIVNLTPEQKRWYKMSPTTNPHISLGLSPNHQAKDLGPMTKHCMEATYWQPTQITQVTYSPSQKAHFVTHACSNSSVLEHHSIDHAHGREKSDGEGSEEMLSRIPEDLWTRGPYDVGLCKTPPITFDYSTPTPIWRPQYKHKPFLPPPSRGFWRLVLSAPPLPLGIPPFGRSPKRMA